jgi:hypothetical protein
MCAQLYLQVISKKPKKKNHLIFMNFEVRNFIEKRNIANKLKYFDVECCNSMDSMDSMELVTKFC